MNHRTQTSIVHESKISNLLFRDLDGRESLFSNILLRLSDETMRSLGTIRATVRLEDSALLLDPSREFDPLLTLDDGDFHSFDLKPLFDAESMVTCAVDVSSIGLGKTEEGILVGLRGAVVWREDEVYHYLRCGPFAFHLSDGSSSQIASVLGFEGPHSEGWFPVEFRLLHRLRNLLEDSLRCGVASSFKNSLLLFDGSLTAGTPDNPARNLDNTLRRARENRNEVLAISKTSRLRICGKRITSLLERKGGPCLVDVDRKVSEQFPPYPVRLLGRVFLCKLSQRGFPFRLDIDRQLSKEEACLSVGRLLANDLVEQGYPETLRLAHVLCIFTRNEVLGMQRLLAKRYALRIIPEVNLRRSLFGPFGYNGEGG